MTGVRISRSPLPAAISDRWLSHEKQKCLCNDLYRIASAIELDLTNIIAIELDLTNIISARSSIVLISRSRPRPFLERVTARPINLLIAARNLSFV